MKTTNFVGKTSTRRNIASLFGKLDVICSTPGRLLDMLLKKKGSSDDYLMNLDELKLLIIDDLDELIRSKDMLQQTNDILWCVPITDLARNK